MEKAEKMTEKSKRSKLLRGYNKFENFRVVILFFCDSLDLYPHDS